MTSHRTETASRTTGRTLDHAAGLYDLLAPLMTLGMETRYHRRVLHYLLSHKPSRVLDVGCGTGSQTMQIANALKNVPNSIVIGVDAAEAMIAKASSKAARCKLDNIRFTPALAEELPYENGEFDSAVSSFFFHHVDRELKIRSLNEIRRTLCDGGKAYIIDVDIPTTWFGKLAAWSGYVLFQQNEILENIRGVLREAMDLSNFTSWRVLSHHQGYITLFELEK